VLWRSWHVVPDTPPGGQPVALLTGIFGFPWREPVIDAKCTEQDRAVLGVDMAKQVDRHHRVVPDPSCTCGIYAGRDELVRPRIARPPRSRPLVTGFVALAGRVIQERDVYRAQQARIVGPLTLWLGRPPLSAAAVARALGRRPRPQRVVTVRDRFEVVWTASRAGTPVAEWLARTAGELARRYGVDVIAIGN
jgi:hypothetical protein